MYIYLSGSVGVAVGLYTHLTILYTIVTLLCAQVRGSWYGYSSGLLYLLMDWQSVS